MNVSHNKFWGKFSIPIKSGNAAKVTVLTVHLYCLKIGYDNWDYKTILW